MAQEVGMSGQTKLTLWCGVFDDQSILSVDVGRDATVKALQQAIFAEKRYAERFRFDASRLKLFLARTPEGAWLQGADADGVLAGKPDDTEYKLMDPCLELSRPEYFGGVEIGEDDEEIHVLVQLPDDAAGGVVEASAVANAVANAVNELTKIVKDLREEMADFRDRMVGAKHKRFVHSEITLTNGRTLLLELKIFVKPVRTVPISREASTVVQPFNWKRMAVNESGAKVAPTEQQLREWRRAYVEDAIGAVLTKKNLYVRSVDKDERVLSVRIPGTDIILEGRTDLLVLGTIVQQSKHYLPTLPDAKLLIETKKAVQSDPHVYEVLSELIALDFLVDEPVMALLTDLTSHWQFFWVAEKHDECAIIQTTIIKDPGAAFAAIRALLEQSPAADVKLPSLPAPVKRRKLAKELATITESVGGIGVREAIKRYYDVASELGPDVELARATADQIVRAIPMFSHLP